MTPTATGSSSSAGLSSSVAACSPLAARHPIFHRRFERDVSTFGAYAEEVTSMDLKWAPLHKSEAFWTANNERLCDDDYRLLRILVRLVQAGEVAEVVCVALNDLGWFASKHPRGRRIVDELGGKAAAMQLMGSENEDVSAAALKTTQRLLLRREWNLGN